VWRLRPGWPSVDAILSGGSSSRGPKLLCGHCVLRVRLGS
jgi:hypothetical protein